MLDPPPQTTAGFPASGLPSELTVSLKKGV